MKKQHKQSGFTLVEMALAMVIVGLLVAFATVGFSGALRFGFEKKTLNDIEVIADAIAVYAQKHMRVPCPADPTGVTGATAGGEPPGTERGSGANGDVFGTCDTILNAEGAIPFATLGLSQRYARDRFGNLLTYRVSVTSAQTPADASDDTRALNNWCMTEPHWYADTDNNGVTDSYVARAKAAFCCGTFNPPNSEAAAAGLGGDIIIKGSYNPIGDTTALPGLSRALPGSGGAAVEYDVPTNPPPTRADLANPGGIGPSFPPRFPAYIIISHGENGSGAYISQTGARPASLADLTAAEAENADGDVIYFATDRLTPIDPGAATSLYRENIDDIVYWQTPAQVLSRIGGLSCGRP